MQISPHQITNIISKLKQAKAPGNKLNSLDIFIKLIASYKRSKCKSETPYVKPTTRATFFGILVQGDLSPRIKDIMRSTYMVALHKDETNKHKLRPLGIPSGIRRITASEILYIYCPFGVQLNIFFRIP